MPVYDWRGGVGREEAQETQEMKNEPNSAAGDSSPASLFNGLPDYGTSVIVHVRCGLDSRFRIVRGTPRTRGNDNQTILPFGYSLLLLAIHNSPFTVLFIRRRLIRPLPESRLRRRGCAPSP